MLSDDDDFGAELLTAPLPEIDITLFRSDHAISTVVPLKKRPEVYRFNSKYIPRMKTCTGT